MTPSDDTSSRYAGGATSTAASASDIDAVACPLGKEGTGRCGTLVQCSVSRGGQRVGFRRRHDTFAPTRGRPTDAARRGPGVPGAATGRPPGPTATGRVSALGGTAPAPHPAAGGPDGAANPPRAFPSTQ